MFLFSLRLVLRPVCIEPLFHQSYKRRRSGQGKRHGEQNLSKSEQRHATFRFSPKVFTLYKFPVSRMLFGCCSPQPAFKVQLPQSMDPTRALQKDFSSQPLM